MNRFQKFIFKHAIWLDWLLPALMTISGAFIGYDIHKLEIGSHYFYIAEFIVPQLGWVLIGSIVFYILIKITEAIAKPRLQKMENELKDFKAKDSIISEQVENLFDGYLYNLAGLLKFGEGEQDCERISLYIHDNDKTFIPCGRYSANPKYKKRTRSSYPDHEGCIAKGWENGWHFDDKFPCPNTEKATYIDYCLKEYDIQRNTTRKINMQSRVFAVLRIKNDADPLVIIVVESIENTRFIENDIKKILQDQNVFLVHTINNLKDYIPRPSIAKEGGI